MLRSLRRLDLWVLLLVVPALLFMAQHELAATDASRGEPPMARVPAPPPLGVDIAIEDPSGHAMDAFHAALRRAQTHRGRARIVVFGASHTAGDEYTGMLRERLQARFGDAGPGFVLPVKPFRGWNTRVARVRSGGSWRVLRGDRGAYGETVGLPLLAVESMSAGTWASIDTTGTSDVERRSVGSYEVWYLRQPGGGRFEVRIDGRAAAVVDTDASAERAGAARFRVRDGAHRIGIRALDPQPVRVFGVRMERDRSGVVLDSLGIPGSRARAHLRVDDTIYRDQLRRRHPDLVVLAYGTNESEDVDVPLSRYEADLRRVVHRVRRTVRGASCLLVGPSDRPLEREDGSWGPRPLTAQVIEVQRRVAASEGCGFFDMVEFMGGEGSMPAWVAHDPPYGRQDRVHLTWHGHRRLADAMERALLEGYER